MSDKKLNFNIQYLRGLCAMVVFFSHTLNIYKIEWVQHLMPTPFHFFFDGQWAVVFFFTLSGFYYYKDSSFSIKGYWHSIVRKSFKIYPPHLISLIVGYTILMTYQRYGIQADSNELTRWASHFWCNDVSIKDFFCNAVVLLPHNPDAINPPSWYLTPEVKMFILMPLIVAVSNRSRNILNIFLLVISCFLMLPMISCVGPFVAGCLLHNYLQKNPNVKIGKLLAIVIALAGCFLLNSRNIAKSYSVDTQHACFMMIQCMGALCFIFLANVLKFKRQFRTLLFLGNISYEIYIIHFVVLMSIAPWIPNHTLFVFLCLSITLFVSYWMNILGKKIILSR